MFVDPIWKEEGSRLVLSYWKEPQAENYTNQIIIEVNQSKSSNWNELIVKHEPKLPSNNIKEVINASKINHLNIEKLIMDAIKVVSVVVQFELISFSAALEPSWKS